MLGKVRTGFLPSCCLIWNGKGLSDRLYWISPGFTGFRGTLLALERFLLGFTGFYWVLPSHYRRFA